MRWFSRTFKYKVVQFLKKLYQYCYYNNTITLIYELFSSYGVRSKGVKVDRYASGPSKLDGPSKSERPRVKVDGHLTNEKGHKYQNGRVIDHVIYMLYAK